MLKKKKKKKGRKAEMPNAPNGPGLPDWYPGYQKTQKVVSRKSLRNPFFRFGILYLFWYNSGIRNIFWDPKLFFGILALFHYFLVVFWLNSSIKLGKCSNIFFWDNVTRKFGGKSVMYIIILYMKNWYNSGIQQKSKIGIHFIPNLVSILFQNLAILLRIHLKRLGKNLYASFWISILPVSGNSVG